MAEELNWIQKLKEATITTQYSVFGYMRLCERELLLNVLPSRVIYLVLLFYYEPEYFDKSPECIQISDDKRTMTRIDTEDRENYHNITFLKQWIDSTSNITVEWVFKIYKKKGKSCDASKGICIGLYSKYDDEYLKLNPLNCNHTPFYVHWASNRKGHAVGVWKRERDDTRYTSLTNRADFAWSQYGHNDKIKLKYDTKESKVYFKVNDNNYRVLFDKIQKDETIKYKIGVVLARIGDSISLIGFNSE